MTTGAAWLTGRNSQGEREEQKYPYRKRKKEKTYLTLTGLLMEGTGPVGPTKLLGDVALGSSRIRWWLHVFGMLALNLGPDLSPKFCAYFATVTDRVRHELRHNRGQSLLQRR